MCDLMAPPSAETHVLHIIQAYLHMNCSQKHWCSLIHRLGSVNMQNNKQSISPSWPIGASSQLISAVSPMKPSKLRKINKMRWRAANLFSFIFQDCCVSHTLSLALSHMHTHTNTHAHRDRGADLFVTSPTSSYLFCSAFVTDKSLHLPAGKGQSSHLSLNNSTGRKTGSAV